MSGTTTNLTEVYAKELQDAQEKYVECHHVFTAAKECVSLLKSQDAPLTHGQKQHLEKVEASIPDLEAALFEAEEELESANISYSFRRFAPATAPQAASIPVPASIPAPDTTKNYNTDIFTGERSEFGMPVFSDPRRQATYEYHETGYKNKYMLKQAYDKQEFLRKMLTDMKREYLTRKKQVKRLQKDAAVDFRNAESSLQEHYATKAADQRPYIYAVDINAPLVSQIQLPRGEILDLKTLHCDTEFAKVRGIHEDLRREQKEQEQRRFEEQEQEQEQSKWWEAEAEALAKWEQRQYEQRRPYAPRGEEQQQQQQQQQEEEQPGRYGDGGYCGCDDLECSDCYSYGNQDDDQSSYDSEYDDPREYNYERECREAEEAAAAAEAAEQQRWEENTRDSDGETWDEEAIANEAEHRREVAQMKLNDDMSYQCDDYPDVVQVTEPRERITAAAAGGAISAKTKAKSKTNAAAAAKARIAKKQQNKFIPIQVTINANRVSVEDAESSSTMLYKGKVQINLPKKNMQASSASREDKKRHDEKWRRINAAQKQSNARGTKIANIPEPNAWWNCGGSDCE
jgi:hypothetical protein